MILLNNGGFTGLRVRPNGNSSDQGSESGAAPGGHVAQSIYQSNVSKLGLNEL